jgi:uncharacterized membrane protein YbhN (UPF0104 family)
MRKHLKPILTVVILALTASAFSYYLGTHPKTVDQIKDMPPFTLLVLLALYACWFTAYALVTRASLHMYNKHMGIQENFLFNAYSNLINFFGPGQSGPIFRGAYLKKKHNLGIKPYMFTLLLYYAFYGVVSAMMMCIGTRPWWQTAILMVVATGGCVVILRWYKKKSKLTNQPLLNIRTLGLIGLATAAQLAVQAVIFGVELHNVGAGASIGQVLAYTGVANLALFVSLTPGAIGIREAFLTFSQQLHHIDISTIVAANVVDRAAYLVFLGMLFLLVIGLHARDKLSIASLNLSKKENQ